MPPPTIAVFGSSEPRPGDAAYDEAQATGVLLAGAGFAVITGAYAGVMEAASAGARSAGGRTLGVACAIFSDRRPNAHLDEVVTAPDLSVRMRELVDRADGFVVLPGRAGTLAELALLWALERAGCLRRRPVILLGSAWKALLEHLEQNAVLESSQLRATRVATDPAHAVALLRASLDRTGGESS